MAELSTTERNNVQAVRNLYEAISNRDVATVLDLLAADVRWQTPEGFPISGVFEGKDEVKRNVLARLPEELGQMRVEVEDLRPVEERVYAHLRIMGTAPNGNDYSFRAIHALDFQDGKVTFFDAIGDTAVLDRALRKGR